MTVIKSLILTAVLSFSCILPAYAHSGDHGFSLIDWPSHVFLSADHLGVLCVLLILFAVLRVATRHTGRKKLWPIRRQ